MDFYARSVPYEVWMYLKTKPMAPPCAALLGTFMESDDAPNSVLRERASELARDVCYRVNADMNVRKFEIKRTITTIMPKSR